MQAWHFRALPELRLSALRRMTSNNRWHLMRAISNIRLFQHGTLDWRLCSQMARKLPTRSHCYSIVLTGSSMKRTRPRLPGRWQILKICQSLLQMARKSPKRSLCYSIVLTGSSMTRTRPRLAGRWQILRICQGLLPLRRTQLRRFPSNCTRYSIRSKRQLASFRRPSIR